MATSALSPSINAKIERLALNADKQDAIINGSIDTVVRTDGGEVDSLAKVVNDAKNYLKQGLDDGAAGVVGEFAAEAKDARDEAVDAKSDAQKTLPAFSNTPPADKPAGRRWTDAATGKSYEWIVTGGHGAWVETGATTAIGYDTAVESKDARDEAVEARDEAVPAAQQAADHEAGALAAKQQAQSARDAALALNNMATSWTEGVGLSASITGPSAFFAVAAGCPGPDGVTLLTQTTCYRRTGPGAAVAFQTLSDGASYAVGTGAFALILKALQKYLLAVGHDGEIYPTRLDGRSIQTALLDLETLVANRPASPSVFSVWAKGPTEGSPRRLMVRMDDDGLLTVPHTGGVPLQDWVRAAVESVGRTNAADGIAIRVKLGDLTLGYMRADDGGLALAGLDGKTVQEAIAELKASLVNAPKLTLEAGTFTLGDSTKAVLVRDPADAAYATGILYVAIPSIAKTGNRLWAAYTANKSVSVNSGEEPGSFCVLRYSDNGGLTWATAMYVAHPYPTIGRTADPTLVVRDGVLYLYFFQSGSQVAYDEAVSTWQIACTNPQADPARAIWSEPVRVQYGFFVTTQFRLNERYVIPLVVLPDALTNAHVKKQHLNIERGTHLYQVFGRSLTKIGSIPFDQPASNRSWGETSVQPCPNGSLLALTRYADGLYFQRSTDGGKSWGAKALITSATGIDATTSSKGSLTITDSGRLCLVWNNSADSARTAMTVALSSDSGATWPVKLLIDGREKVSYPNVAHDGDAIHIVYDRDRMVAKRVYHVALSEAALVAGTQTITINQVSND